MFSTFTKEGDRTLIIRTESLVRLEDTDTGCKVAWVENGEILRCHIDGTAQENYERLKVEELKLMEMAAERQRRYDQGLPLLPVPRGKAVRL